MGVSLKKPKYSGTVLLAGATGYIGQYVCKTLLDRGYKVISIGRSQNGPFAHTLLRHYSFEMLSREKFKELIVKETDVDAVISCLGSRSGGKRDSWNVEFNINENLLFFAKGVGAKQFILLSAICVQKPKLEFQFAKLAFENSLITSGMPYSIVRPTAYFKSLAGQVENVKSGKAFLVFDNGDRTACKPISGKDLAHFICDCITSIDRLNQVLPIGGPGMPITLKEQAQMLFSLLGKNPNIRRIPSFLFYLLIAFLGPIALFSEKISDKREFLRIGYYYATESMLFWDEPSQSYSAEKTPEFGSDTLRNFYKEVLISGLQGHELGPHKIF